MEISNNLNAIQTYSNRLNENAQELASETFSNQADNALSVAQADSEASDGIARNLTDNIEIENGLDAQVRSISANNQILGTVLDIKS